MKLLLLLALPLCSCASTTVSENGKKVFATNMNCTYMSYRSPAGSTLIVHGMNHSSVIRAQGSVLGTGLSGIGGVGAVVLGGGVVR